MHRIVVLLLPPVVGFDAAIAPTLFSSATDADGNALYDVVTAGLSGGPVESTTGFSVLPSAGAEALATADTVVIPGTRYPPARIDGTLPADVSAALALDPSRHAVGVDLHRCLRARRGRSARRTARDHALEVR